MQTYDKTIEFLYKAIEDAQATIRFTDTKAGAVLVGSGIMSGFFVPIGKVLLNHVTVPLTFLSVIIYFVGIIFCVTFFLSIFSALRGINPMSSPADHINTDGLTTTSTFYLWNISPKMNVKDLLVERSCSVLNHNAKELFEKIINNQDDEIIKCLVLEHCKLSYIREKKIFRVNTAISLFAYSVVLIIILSLLLNYVKWF